jgi:hypothetical protein
MFLACDTWPRTTWNSKMPSSPYAALRFEPERQRIDCLSCDCILGKRRGDACVVHEPFPALAIPTETDRENRDYDESVRRSVNLPISTFDSMNQRRAWRGRYNPRTPPSSKDPSSREVRHRSRAPTERSDLTDPMRVEAEAPARWMHRQETLMAVKETPLPLVDE